MAFSTLCMPLRRPLEDLVTETFFTSLLDKHLFFQYLLNFDSMATKLNILKLENGIHISEKGEIVQKL